MAVQAQYPSNVLLLNRNSQEGEPGGGGAGAGGGFLEQTHMLFNNGGNINPRKRGREVSSASGVISAVNPFCFQQSHQPHLVDLSQLHNHHNNVVSTGLRLASGDQNRQNFYQSSVLVSLLSDDFASHIKQQREEIDQFLQAQEEELRRTLAEKRQRHYRELLGAAEESAARRLREKEAEVEKATRRNAELEARAARLNMEAQAWQAKARAEEAAAVSLHAQLQQAIMRGGGGEGRAEDAESAYVDPDRVVESGPSCKACRRRVASVVLLPCRHLCLCPDCDRVAQACPLCRALRNSSVEVFLS